MIKLRSISKKYKSNIIFKDLSYEFKNTGFYFLLGKSGSGKTTLLNLIGGLESTNNGAIERKDDVCYVFQEANLLTDFTVFENIKITGIQDKKIDEILESLQILNIKNKVVHLLSGGEKQRVAIARALALNKNIILLDEPTGNLDRKNSIKLIEILKEISKKKLVIMATHDTGLSNYGDIILEISNKKIIEKVQNKNKVNIEKNEEVCSLKLFGLRFQFLYAIKLLKNRPIKYGVTVLLSMLSLLLLFLILNVVFFNENKVIQKAVLTDNRYLYSISRSYYNIPTMEYLDYTYGKDVESKLKKICSSDEYFYYKKITFPFIKDDRKTEFQIIISNLEFDGIYITDFISNYLFSNQDCIGKDIDIEIDDYVYSLKINGLIKTDYLDVYESYFSSEKYMNNHIDDFLFHYATLYISINTFKGLISEHPLFLLGTNFTLNDLDLKTYMNSYYITKVYFNDSLSFNQVTVSNEFYNSFMKDIILPATYDIRNIEASINANLYINKFNLYNILEEALVIDTHDANYDILVSEEMFSKIVDEYIYFKVDGICLKDTKKIDLLHQNCFRFINEDINKIYLLNEIFNNVLKITVLVICILIALVSMLALYFSVVGFMDKKAKEFYIMKSLGISSIKISNIFIIYTLLVIIPGLAFALLFGNISISFLNDYLKNGVFYIDYNLFILQYEPYFIIFGIVIITVILIIISPLNLLKKIDLATLVKLNN